MRYIVCLPAFVLAGFMAISPARGQRAIPAASHLLTAQDSVKTAVNLLFAGMKTSDPAMIRRSFTDSAILQTISVGKNGQPTIHTEDVAAFAALVGKLAPGSADERISFDVVRIDGPLAIVWAPYNFYYNGQFSHCGVDSFQLVLVDGVWKIQYLIDTRRKQGCQP